MTSKAAASTLSLSEIIQNQQRLEEEAAEAIPFSFSKCTYAPAIEETRQPIYSCLSCRPQPLSDGTRAGICAACSVSCHGDCELVELFTRRNFTCDCGTNRIPGRKCTLTLRENEIAAEGNKYDENFDGIFCSCKIRYDPETEEDEMVQCLFCENWYHTNKCLSSSGKKRLHTGSFDTLICEACVLGTARSTIGRYAGKNGFMLLSNDGTFIGQRKNRPTPAVEDVTENNGPSTVRSEPDAREEPPVDTVSTAAKRERSSSAARDTPEAKRLKTEIGKEPSCRAPSVENVILQSPDPVKKHVFLDDDWRDELCRCNDCMQLYIPFPFLLDDESIYEPPEDPDSQKSLLELGTNALMEMPREQAIRGLEAYNTMKTRLSDFLRPFAADGKVVSGEDMERFFLEQREQHQKR